MPRFPEPEKRDPYRNFNFRVEIGGIEVLACRKCSGLTASVEVVKFRAGSDRSTVDQKMPGRVMYEPVTLENGITKDTAFEDWAKSLVQHDGSTYMRMVDTAFRREVRIKVYDLDGTQATPVKVFVLHRAWVSKFTALSELSGEANETLIETLELQHEGFTKELVPA